tara:strand:- start:2173 stop:3969 length:1797 start_codon:yes stop_codon:yes gene_type:complete
VNVLEEDLIRVSNGEDVCQNCYDEEFTTCYGCQDEIHNDSSRYSEMHGENYCDDCYEDTFSSCAECDAEVHRDEIHFNHRDEPVCEYCYMENSDDYPEWEVFEKEFVENNRDFIHPSKQLYNFDEQGNLENMNLNKDALKDFIDNTNNELKDSFKKIKSKRYVGSEIEFNHNGVPSDVIDKLLHKNLASKNRLHDESLDRGTGHIEHDGSITSEDCPYGHELVLQPRRGDIFYDDMKTITSTLKNSNIDGFISSRCGYHIHIDTRDFDWIHCSVLTSLVKLSEPHIFASLPSSRLQGRWSYPVSQGWNSFKYATSRDEFIQFWYDNGNYTNDKYNDKRYHGLNFHPKFQANGGVEIRYHSGTLNPKKMLHWNIFWTQMFDTARRIGDNILKENDFDVSKTILGYNKYINSIREGISPSEDLSERAIFLHDEHYNYQADEKAINGYENGSSVSIKEYKDVSNGIMDLLEFSEDDRDDLIAVPQAVLNLGLKRTSSRDNHPLITKNSMYKMIELPTDTIQYFEDRFDEINNSEMTENNHLYDCYNRINRVVKFDENKNRFETIDYLNHRLLRLSDFTNVNNQSRRIKPVDLEYINNYITY